jgi:RNA polymerase sigma-70 factor, ECF subfamily
MFAAACTCMDQSDRLSLDLISSGDEQTFEAVFRAHYTSLCAFSRKFVADPDAAEELVQDLFLNLWEKRAELTPTQSLRSYLFAAVRNSCLNHLKHLKVRARHQEHSLALAPEFAEDPQAALQAAELQARIGLAIDALPDRCGEIFKMSRFEGLKYQEIADQLALSPRTVEVQIGKALKLLRQALGDYLPLILLTLLLEEFIL